MRRTIAILAVCGIVLSSVTCSPLTSPLDLIGTYALRTVNGGSMPYTLSQQGSTTVLVLDDTFTLTSSGAYSELGHEQVTSGGVVSVSVLIDAGTFTRKNTDVMLNSTLFGARPASVKGGRLTIVQNGLTLVYQM